MKTLYAIYFKTGEYEDFREIYIYGSTNKTKTEEKLKDIKEKYNNDENNKDLKVWDFEYNDMCLTVDYTGAQFEIVELQFED